MRDWLTSLWKLRSPTICLLQAGRTGEPVGVIQPKGLRIREADGINHGPRVEEDGTAHLSWHSNREAEKGANSFFPLSSLRPRQTDSAHSHHRERSTLRSPPLQMLILSSSSYVPSPLYPEILFNVTLQGRSTHKINYHSLYAI